MICQMIEGISLDTLPGRLPGSGSVASLLLPGHVHVDADGGRGSLLDPCEGLCQAP